MPGDKIHSATQKSWIKDEQQLIGGFYKWKN
jgi:hypothetical protein